MSGILPISAAVLDADYTLTNIQSAVAFAALPPTRPNREKDVRSEDEAIDAAMIQDPEVVAEARFTYRRNAFNAQREDRERRGRDQSPPANDRLTDEPQATFDSYA